LKTQQFSNRLLRLRQALAIHAKRFLFIWFITTAVVLSHAFFAPESTDTLSRFYLWSVPSYYLLLMAILFIISLPLLVHRVLRFILGFGLWVWLVYLFSNLAVFNLYGFHLDVLLIQMFFLDFRGIGLPWPVFVAGLMFYAGLAALIWAVFRITTISGGLGKFLNKTAAVILIAGIPVFVANQLIHAWAARFDISKITQYTPYFPLYYPVTSSSMIERWAQRYPALKPQVSESIEVQGTSSVKQSGGRIHYPKAALTCTPKTKPSILLVVLESWQTETLNDQVMPNTWRLAQQSFFFRQHVSSGASTVAGFFGLMYGLHPSYYASFRSQANQHPALLTETAHQLGYQTRVFTSGDFERFALRTLFFSKVNSKDFYSFNSDELVIQKAQEIITQTPVTQPTLDIVFLTSSHSPYKYPPEHQRFTPVPAIKGAYAFNKNIDPIPFRNDYRNSLHHVDHQFGKLIDTLRASGRFDQRWIVVTGDHAEEFNESGLGYWGHGSNYSRWQTGTPLVVKPANQFNGQIMGKLDSKAVGQVVDQASFHQDIAPTLLRHAFGCTNPLNDYSNGLSLFDLPSSRQAVLASYSTQAYFFNGVIWERSTGKRYQWKDMNQRVDGKIDPDQLKSILAEETHFFRPK